MRHTLDSRFPRFEVKTFAHGHVVRQQVTRNGLSRLSLARIFRYHIDDPGAVIDTHDKRLDALEWH